MLTKLVAFIRQQDMIAEGDHIICAISGGADSVALLFAMYLLKDKLKIRLSAAHFNHHLRGEESDRDEAFVKEFCESRGCEFALAEVWAKGGEGGIALANKVLDTLEHKESNFHVLYEDSLSLKDKIKTVATKIYGADNVTYNPAAEKMLALQNVQ